MSLPEIQLTSCNYPVSHYLPRMYRDEVVDPFVLDAPYQRGSVWTIKQRRLLIKSLLMRLPVGAIVISALPYMEGRGSWRVIDGKQRIETVRAFFNGEFAVPREWFRDTYLAPCPNDTDGDGGCANRHCPWEGKMLYPDDGTPMVSMHHLTDTFRRVFENAPMPALEFKGEIEWLDGRGPDGKWLTRQRSEEEILQAEAEVFGLINGGGTAQTAEDMARARSVAEG